MHSAYFISAINLYGGVGAGEYVGSSLVNRTLTWGAWFAGSIHLSEPIRLLTHLPPASVRGTAFLCVGVGVYKYYEYMLLQDV